LPARKILFHDNPLLRQKSQKLKKLDDSTQTLIDDMLETMRANNGVGLAAPQVGVLQRVIVIEIPADPEEPGSKTETYALVNPEIIKRSEEEEIADEGCLCLPHYLGEVARAYAVTAKGRDRRGKEVRVKGEGLLARALQHEIDHLDGILFTDRVEDASTLRYVQPKPDTAAAGDAPAQRGRQP
jgi:peptide deformylase